jgi:hypothetical protein
MRKYRISVMNPKGLGTEAGDFSCVQPGRTAFVARLMRLWNRDGRRASGTTLQPAVTVLSRSGAAFPLILSERARRIGAFATAALAVWHKPLNPQ